MKKIWSQYGRFILPGITGGLVLLLMISYLFPNKVLDTYVMNLSEEGHQEEEITLPEGSVVSYSMETGTRPLRGIQPGIGIAGGRFEQGQLHYRVFSEKDNLLLSDNTYPLSNLSDTLQSTLESTGVEEHLYEAQYTYLPLADYEKCIGNIRIEFSYESNGESPRLITGQETAETIVPFLLINDVQKEGSTTKKDGKLLRGGLTGYYVYTHNTYPLVYDLKILIFLLLATTVCAGIREKQKTEDVS